MFKDLQESIQQQSKKAEDIICELNDLSQELGDVCDNINGAFEHLDWENNPLFDYINELEKDFYFRNQSCKDNLTVEKIVYDLVKLAKEIRE